MGKGHGHQGKTAFSADISGIAELISDKFTCKTSLVPRSEEFEGQNQRSRTPGIKNSIFGPLSGLSAVYVW